MRKMIFSISLILSLFLFGCNQENDDTQESDTIKLEKMYDEIVLLANSQSCTNPSDWNFVAIGAKACGGPTGYVSYSNKIDAKSFLDKVLKYTNAQKDFNKKWGAFSDCMYLSPPTKIICENEKSKLIY